MADYLLKEDGDALLKEDGGGLLLSDHCWLLTEAGDYLVTEAGARLQEDSCNVTTATAAITDADDTVAATGDLGFVGTLAATDPDDTLAATGSLDINATAAITEPDDTLAATGYPLKNYNRSHTTAMGLVVERLHSLALGLLVSRSHTARLPYEHARRHTAVWDIRGLISREHEADYAISDRNLYDRTHVTGSPLVVTRTHSNGWQLLEDLSRTHVAAAGLYEDYSRTHTANWALEDDTVTLSRSHVAWYHLGNAEAQVATVDVVCTVGGVEVDLISASLAQDNGGQWSTTLRLADPYDYARFGVDTAFTLELGATAWSMWVDRRTRRKSGADGNGATTYDVEIFGLGAPAGLDDPRADPVSKTWEEPILASAAVAELIGSVTWDMIDWQIPAFRLSVLNASPLAAARQIVNAAGGVLHFHPDGSITARAEYPVPMPQWETTTPDSTLTGMDDIFSVDEALTVDKLMDSIRIYDSEPGFADRLELVPDETDSLKGTIRAYPSPWRDVSLRTSADSLVSIAAASTETREVTEVVEFKLGIGSVQYPIMLVSSVEWITTDLGGVTHGSYDPELRASVEGYSLAEITYYTKALEYDVTATEDTWAQFILEDAA